MLLIDRLNRGDHEEQPGPSAVSEPGRERSGVQSEGAQWLSAAIHPPIHFAEAKCTRRGGKAILWSVSSIGTCLSGLIPTLAHTSCFFQDPAKQRAQLGGIYLLEPVCETEGQRGKETSPRLNADCAERDRADTRRESQKANRWPVRLKGKKSRISMQLSAR